MGKTTDLLIIGAGPTGLFGAFYAGLRGMSVRIVDALAEPGGQITAMYPEKWIYDIPGFPRIKGKDLVDQLVEQTDAYNPQWNLGEQAEQLTYLDDERLWQLTTDSGTYQAGAVVLCAGIGAFKPRTLPDPSIAEFEGKGLVYFVKELDAYAGRKVLIVGGGDSAVDWALALQDRAEVTLIHRRDKFRAHEASVKALESANVDIRVFHELKSVQGGAQLESATIVNSKTDEVATLDVDAVILSLGFIADLGPLKSWDLTLSGKRYIEVDAHMQTSKSGVFAAGDIAAPPDLDPLNLIAVGFGQVTTAVNYAYVHLHPDARVFPGHSSEAGH